jgi:membrane-associated protease RseP (regulator of RpoE activity)
MEVADKKKKRRIIQVVLFFVTIISTTFAGAEWMYGKSAIFYEPTLSFSEILSGLYFSLPFLGILTVHEFGHYFTAKYYNIKVTLPYYIPLWLGFLGIPFTIGTMGAFIRIKDLIKTRKQYFDVGVAGPLAGFVVAMMVLTYGFTNLPEPDYIFKIHPEYEEYGLNYEEYYETLPANMAIGDNLVFLFFKNFVADPERVPNRYEMYHYPWLFAGFLALFFTALNLIPIGQLDGGHVIYGLFGFRKSRIISRALFLILVTISGVGFVPSGVLDFTFFVNAAFYLLFLFLVFHHFEKNLWRRILLVIWIMIIQIFSFKLFPEARDYAFYMLFAFLIGRFLGIDHPRAIIDQPLDLKRKVIGWITLIVFIISFTPRPLYFEINEKARIEESGPNDDKDDIPSKVITWRMIEIF